MIDGVQSGSHNIEKQERMRRLRIAATGLAAVFLVVLSAGALTNSASDEPAIDKSGELAIEPGLPAIIGNNLAREPLPQEPLVELGVTPSTDSENGTGTAQPVQPPALPMPEETR